MSFAALLVCLCSYRLVFLLIDMSLFTIPPTILNWQWRIFSDLHHYKRKQTSRTVTSFTPYDYCNILSTVLSWIQLIRSVDVNGWRDRYPVVYIHAIGTFVNCLCLTQVLIISTLWIQLVFLWSDPFRK